MHRALGDIGAHMPVIASYRARQARQDDTKYAIFDIHDFIIKATFCGGKKKIK